MIRLGKCFKGEGPGAFSVFAAVGQRLAWAIGDILAIAAGSELGLLLNDFYNNVYEQIWFQNNYPVIYAILINPWPTLELGGLLVGMVIGLIMLHPWDFLHARRLEATGSEGVVQPDPNTPRRAPAPVAQQAAKVQGEVPVVAVPVPPPPDPTGASPQSLTARIQSRIAGMGSLQPVVASPATIAGPNSLAATPPTVPIAEPKQLARELPGINALISQSHQDFATVPEPDKYVFNRRKLRFEPSKD